MRETKSHFSPLKKKTNKLLPKTTGKGKMIVREVAGGDKTN